MWCGYHKEGASIYTDASKEARSQLLHFLSLRLEKPKTNPFLSLFYGWILNTSLYIFQACQQQQFGRMDGPIFDRERDRCPN